MDGTRTFLVGEDPVAVIDPGPNMDEHVRALSLALEGASAVHILLTHSHRDHAGAAHRLAELPGAVLFAPPSYEPPEPTRIMVTPLNEGDTVATDQGGLTVIGTPGHTRDHLAFFWEAGDSLFVGDLILGRGETTWIGEYPGCVADYLKSLDRVVEMGVSVLYPSHGPPVTSPSAALAVFRRHRLERVEEVRMARRRHPEADAEDLARLIYGSELPPKLRNAARSSVEAALFHLDRGNAPS